MRHGLRDKRLNRTSAHLKAMLINMSNSLIMHEQIKTTLPKAKILRPYLEKLITLGRRQDLHAKRRLLSILRDELAVRKLQTSLFERYKDRKGGYLRILKTGFRYGDNAPMAYIEFIDRDEAAKGKDYYSDEAKVASKVAEEDKAKPAAKAKTKTQSETVSAS